MVVNQLAMLGQCKLVILYSVEGELEASTCIQKQSAHQSESLEARLTHCTPSRSPQS